MLVQYVNQNNIMRVVQLTVQISLINKRRVKLILTKQLMWIKLRVCLKYSKVMIFQTYLYPKSFWILKC